ncbi:midcut-by-XrtH protein [Ottowia sp. GY511]|uniref:Midcut-by-XrtH protein n=1 Tax=Ottowia flava TaxID=2675430 RepID=A0ABW4KWT2_9BURK|nr:midcut-by-XrtH protein [Ottowia sp. GY511]TXK29829.1 midcut-by-XrtH protein [Ottowia sp. GY511]
MTTLSIRNAVRCSAAAAMLGAGTLAHAGTIVPPGGTIDYAPLAAAVPTLGQWSLALIVLLVVAVAYRVLRGRVGGKLMSNLLILGGAAVATFTGHGVVREAAAIAAQDVSMSSTTGGSVTGNYWLRATNGTAVTLKITDIRPNEGVTIESPPPEVPECTVGAQVTPGNKCSVHFVFVPS